MALAAPNTGSAHLDRGYCYYPSVQFSSLVCVPSWPCYSGWVAVGGPPGATGDSLESPVPMDCD